MSPANKLPSRQYVGTLLRSASESSSICVFVMTPEQFQSLVSPLVIAEQPVAIAVSGGADSLALTLLYDEFLRAQNLPAHNMVAITVDHRLRDESAAEAKMVCAWLAARGIHHETLVWDHVPLTSGIEEKARQARYALLTDYCRTHSIPNLLTAHHAQDQLETFYMRLARGSSLAGLCSIHPRTVFNGTNIVRPLLKVFPDELRATLTDHFHQPFITDPSNFYPTFERVRWRQLFSQIPLLQSSAPHILASIEHLQAVFQQIDAEAQKFIHTRVFPHSEGPHGKGGVFIKNDLLALLPTVGQRALKLLIDTVSNDFTPWPNKVLESLYHKLWQPNFRAATAHHCVIRSVAGHRLGVFPENRPIRKLPCPEVV